MSRFWYVVYPVVALSSGILGSFLGDWLRNSHTDLRNAITTICAVTAVVCLSVGILWLIETALAVRKAHREFTRANELINQVVESEPRTACVELTVVHEPDDTDMTPEDFWKAMAEGQPVKIVSREEYHEYMKLLGKKQT